MFVTLRCAACVILIAACAGPVEAQTAANSGPPPGSASVRVSGSSLGRIRVGAADPAIWFGWRIGIPASAFRQLTLSEAAAKADALGLGTIEGSNSQEVSYEIPKPLDHRLQTGERAAINNRLRDLNVRMLSYRVDSIGSDESSRRKVFDFAKSVGVENIVCSPDTTALADLDKLANEYGINVALRNGSRKATPALWDPKSLITLLQGRSKRIAVSADIGAWLQEGINPQDALLLLKDRIIGFNLQSIGSEAAGLDQLFLQAYRLELKPLFLTIDTTGAADTFADLSRSVDAFESTLQPAMTARVAQVVDSPQGAIRGPEKLSAEMRQKIAAAVPAQAIAKPKKPRRLLVMDLNMYSGHGTIPHGNLLLELLGKKTGAFEAVFSNDLNNLKYPNITQFDAVFLNSMAGMMFSDPAVRDGLIRYVREGGGLGGVHATTYAAMDWPEFTEMIGAGAGEHRTEKQVLKVDDPGSPLNAAFTDKSFEHTDEFYHFPASAPYSREKLHVLLSIDVEKSDMATSGRMCAKCTRPDHDYGMSWIRSYGKGRVFITPLGHTDILFTTPAWVHHVFGGVQFILGDLDADTTPSARLAAKKK